MALPTLAECLVEAEAAYHDLMMGKSVVTCADGNSGDRIEYGRASARNLAVYIADLKRRIGGRSNPSTYIVTVTPRRRY